MLLGPGVNIKRSPLCGRNFEYFSEDPALAGALGTAFVQGVQSQGVGTSVKHFAANNQETDRVRVSADVDERTLREIYLPAFERIVKEAQPWTVMCSYNRLNGTHTSQDPWLLTTVLREEWGFDGVVVSDWGAVHDRVAALAAGLDLEMPPQLGWSDVAIVDAVRSGDLDEAVLDVAVARMLRLVERATTEARPGTTVDHEAHHALARVAAREGAVLLKNDGAVLPLALSSGQTVAVIGELARTPRYQGAGSSQVNPTRLDVPLDELRAAVPDGVEVTFEPGPRRRGRRARRCRRRGRAVPRSGTGGRVRGLRPLAHGPARRAGRPGAPGGGRQRPRGGRPGQRLGGAHVGLGAGRRRDPGVLAVRAGGRGSGRRPAARRGQPERPARGDHPSCRSRTPRPTCTSRATPATCATGRASSWATAATTPGSRP